LQLFHAAGEITDHCLKAIDARQQVGGGILRAGGMDPKRARENDHEGGADHRRQQFRWIADA
jgi:hypothetical protein